MGETIYARGAPSNAPMRIANYLNDQLALSKSLANTGGYTTRGHEQALESVASYLISLYRGGAGRESDTQELMLGEIFAATKRHNTGQMYDPSSHAKALLQFMGQQRAIDAREVVWELCALELRDLARGWSQRENLLQQGRQEADEAAAGRNRAEARARVAEKSVTETAEELAAAKADRDELRRHVDFLSGRLEALGSGEEPPEAPTLTPAEEDRPAAELLEAVVTRDKRRVSVAPNVYLELKDGAPWYRFRKGSGRNELQLWLAPEASVSLADAIAACERWANAHGPEAEPVAVGVGADTSNEHIEALLAEAQSANEETV